MHKKAVADRLLQLCEEKNIAVNALATRSGVTPSTVYSMLNEKSQNPGVVSIKKLCDGLGISVREFFDCDLFDDNEQENMKKISDEVFGNGNFIAQVIWERAFAPVNLKKHFSESHDYLICYAKNKEILSSQLFQCFSKFGLKYNNSCNYPNI